MDPRGLTLDDKIKHIESMFISLSKVKQLYERQIKSASDRATLEYEALLSRLSKAA